MRMSSLPSTKYLPNSVAQRGLGGFFDTLLTTVGNYTAGQQAVSIANSQSAAIAAQANAQQAAANAAAIAANKPAISSSTLLMIAGGLGAFLLINRLRKH